MRRLTPLAVLGLWSALALLVQRWATIADGIREQYAFDVSYYEVIARAAPSLPDEHVLRPYAERFPAHWLVGTLAELTGASLQSVYRVVGFAFVAAAVVATHAAIRTCGSIRARTRSRSGSSPRARTPPLRPRRARNGRRRPLSRRIRDDAARLRPRRPARRRRARARDARAADGGSRRRGRRRLGRRTPRLAHETRPAVAATLVAPSAVYLLLRTVGASFASPHIGDVHDLTIVGFLVSPSLFAEHVARTVLGIAVPAALVLGLWWRTRAHLPRGTLLVAAVIVAQPFVLGPSSAGDNEPRLAALALPALAPPQARSSPTYG